MKIEAVELCIKRAYNLELDIQDEHVYNDQEAAKIFCSTIGNCNAEHVAAICLDRYEKILNYHTVCIGETDSVKVALAQLFRYALLSNAVKLYVAHNHPSGVLEITSDDIEMTKKIHHIASLFDISLVDSLIVSGSDHVSIRRHCKEL